MLTLSDCAGRLDVRYCSHKLPHKPITSALTVPKAYELFKANTA